MFCYRSLFNCCISQSSVVTHLRCIQVRSKKRIGLPRFNFGITSVIQHRFNHSFTVISKNLCRVNMKFFHPPHLYCVAALPSKTNTTLISVLNLTIVLKWCSAAQAKLQCSMCPQPFLITASRRRRHSLIFNETLWEFLPLGDYRSLQFFTVFNCRWW